MMCQSAYFIQFKTYLPVSATEHAGIATVIVFAETREIAQSRAGRLLSQENHQITGIIRLQPLNENNLLMFGSVLKSLYCRAELYGAAIHFDSLPTCSRC